MNFFFDANMSHRYAKMISATCEGSHEIVHISDHTKFKHNNHYSPYGNWCGNDTPDLQWIHTLREEKEKQWKIVSGESGIIDTAHERAALVESQLTFFSMDHNWGKASFWEQAWKLVKIWERILQCAEETNPILYRVQMGRQLNVQAISGGGRARGGRFRS